MDKSTTFADNSGANNKKELEYEPPVLTEINMLDESAVGDSFGEEPNPPG